MIDNNARQGEKIQDRRTVMANRDGRVGQMLTDETPGGSVCTQNPWLVAVVTGMCVEV